MRKSTLFSLALITIAAGCAETAPLEIFKVQYGTSRYLWRDGSLAEDYIADDRKVVPAGLRACGVKFLSFDDGMTDGAEAAYFAARSDDKAAFACIKKAFPQGAIERRPPEIIEGRKLQVS